MTNRLLKQVW